MAKANYNESPAGFSGSSLGTSGGLQMDPDTARALSREGGSLVLLDLPQGSEFGIDMVAWNTGDKFKGVKMIPQGIHFIYWSAVSKEGSTAPRTGFFHDFGRSEVVVRKYDRASEDVLDTVSQEDKERIRANIRGLDSNLGPYPYDRWKQWISLTNRITPATIARQNETQMEVDSTPGERSRKSRSRSRNRSRSPNEPTRASSSSSRDETDEETMLPRMSLMPGTMIRYTDLPKERYPSNSTPEEITKHSMDSTFQLETFLKELQRLYGDTVSSSMSDANVGEEVLAELQFAFICFLVGQHYDSFEHWKHLLNMLCSCYDALALHADLYLTLMMDLHFQIREVPDDFFVDIVSNNNFLVTLFTRLFASVRANEAIDPRLKCRAEKFQANLSKKFQWDFDEDLEEDAPVVVELDNN